MNLPALCGRLVLGVRVVPVRVFSCTFFLHFNSVFAMFMLLGLLCFWSAFTRYQCYRYLIGFLQVISLRLGIYHTSCSYFEAHI